MVVLDGSPSPVTLEETNKISEQMKKSVCKIFSNHNPNYITGFFCCIDYNNNKIRSLITVSHEINMSELLPNKSIKIIVDEEEKSIEINESRIIYSNEEYDITIIEIKPEDKIDYFLDIDKTILTEKRDSYKDSYLIQFNDEKVYVSYGILESESERIKHTCSTKQGSSGSPIFNLHSNKVIGIHVGGNELYNYNIGFFLDNPIKAFINDLEMKKYKKYNSKDFNNKKMISSGSYGDVYSAFSIKDKIEICLKEINLEKMKLNYQENDLKNYIKDLNNEIKILKLLSDNKNSVKFYGSYDENNQKVIVMEKCDKNLRQFIKERGKGMEIEEIKVKFIELNKLFKLIQKENIIHRDLKLENFLIKYTNFEKNEYIIKLCDYGIGKFKNESNGLFSGLKGTPETISPEILLQKAEMYENIVDIFSLGIILYQLSHNLTHPFGNYKQLYSIYSANYDNDNLTINFDESIKSKEFKDLIVKMTKLNPKNRLKWDKYFDHPFFK